MTQPAAATETVRMMTANDSTILTLQDDHMDDNDAAASSTLSPVAARKQHFESIFRKEPLSLTSPSEFKHYAPGSLVKKRHSWLQEEVIENKKPLPLSQKHQFKSPLLRRLVKQRSHTPTLEQDENNPAAEHAPSNDVRDEQDQDNLHADASRESLPTEEAVQVVVASSDQSPCFATQNSELREQVDGQGDNKPSTMEVSTDNLHHDIVGIAHVSPAPMEEIEITVSSNTGGDDEENALDISALETDERGNDVSMTIDFHKQQAALRRQAQQEKLKAAQRRHRKLKRADSDDDKIAAEKLVPTLSAEVADKLQQQPPSLAVVPSHSQEHDEWQLVRVNSQPCDAKCLDSLTCNIL